MATSKEASAPAGIAAVSLMWTVEAAKVAAVAVAPLPGQSCAVPRTANGREIGSVPIALSWSSPPRMSASSATPEKMGPRALAWKEVDRRLRSIQRLYGRNRASKSALNWWVSSVTQLGSTSCQTRADDASLPTCRVRFLRSRPSSISMSSRMGLTGNSPRAPMVPFHGRRPGWLLRMDVSVLIDMAGSKWTLRHSLLG